MNTIGGFNKNFICSNCAKSITYQGLNAADVRSKAEAEGWHFIVENDNVSPTEYCLRCYQAEYGETQNGFDNYE